MSKKIIGFIIFELVVAVLFTGRVWSSIDVSILDDPISQEKDIENKFNKNKNVTQVSIVMSADEYEPLSLVIRAVGNDEKLTVSSTSLIGPGGKVDNFGIDFKWVKYWYQANGAWRTHRVQSPRTAVYVPELLVNDPALIKIDHLQKQNYLRTHTDTGSKYRALNKIDTNKRGTEVVDVERFDVRDAEELQPLELSEQEYSELWGTVHAPIDTPAGIYTGQIKITTNSQKLSIPISIEILPLRLTPPVIEYSIYYRGVLEDGTGTISSEKKSREQLIYELKNMKAHGIESPTIYQKINSKTKLEEHLAIRNWLGFSTESLYYAGFTTGKSSSLEELFKLRNKVRKVKKIANKYGYQNVYIYGVDEGKGKELGQQRAPWSVVKEQGAKVFVAGYQGHSKEMDGITDLLIQHGKPSMKEARDQHSKGNRIFSYSNPQAGIENPYVYRKNFGIHLWQKNFDGAMDYAYQHSMGFIWNDFDHWNYRDILFTYPTTTGVIDTIAWEGFREGVDDVRYLSTLLSLRTKFVKVDNSQLASEIDGFLDKLKSDSMFDPKQTRDKIQQLLKKYCLDKEIDCYTLKDYQKNYDVISEGAAYVPGNLRNIKLAISN